jgi:tetratricopeptide (TPR) repeat protein
MVVAGLLLSCIRPPASSPVQSGQPWVALQSKHFRVTSDLDEGEANRVIGGFEETYGLLGEAVFGVTAAPSFQTSAVIFDNHQDLNDFIGEGFDGMYMPSLPNDVEPAPIMLAAGTLSPFARLTFAHELTHRFNHVALGPTPTWLNEGLADYYSTIRSDHGKPVLGEIDPRYMCTPDGLGDLVCWEYDKLPGQSLPTASQVMALDRVGFYGESTLESGRDSWEQKRKRAANYGASWLLVHLLMTSSQDYAQEFRRVLAGPPSGEKGAKLADVVSRVPKAQLDGDFKRYLKQGIPWRQHHLPAPPAPSDLERRTLSNSEVLLLWARIDSFNGKFRARALERLNQAHQSGDAGDDGDAFFWLGRYYQVQEKSAQAEEQYKLALSLKPGNAEYLYGLLDLYWRGQGKAWVDAARSDQVKQTVAELTRSAHTGAQLNAVAAHQLLSNDVQTALATSEKACAASPDCWPCFHNYAAALFEVGRRNEALDAEREALSRMPEGTGARLVTMVTRSVTYYETAATGGSVPSDWSPGLVAP